MIQACLRLLGGERASKHVAPTHKMQVAFLFCRPSVHLVLEWRGP